MTIDELLSLAGLTANDEIPVWDAEAADEPTKKITAQNLAASVKTLAGLAGEAELTEQLADKADVIVDTASGAIASFPDGAAVAAKDVTIGIEPVQSGSGDPSPENVRPISGWTGANVTRTGKNIAHDVVYADALAIYGPVIQAAYSLKQGKTYVISWYTKNTGIIIYRQPPQQLGFTSLSAYSFTCDGTRKWIYGVASADAEISKRTIIARSSDTSSTGSGLCYNFMIEEVADGVTAPSDYAPYTGTIIPISWQSEAGTVYGGKLDVTTGLLTVTMASVDLGNLYWSVNGGDRFSATNQMPNVKIDSDYTAERNAYCSMYKWKAGNLLYAQSDPGFSYYIENNANQLFVKNTTYTDAAAFKAAMSGVKLVYELATPQTYQLTPTEVEMLFGDNNVWADTGDSTVAYRADTKLYIQKINAPTDDDMIADAQIASGKYFIVGGNLYKSTTTIPAGDTITPGSNCILTNLADALNALNT